MDQEPTSIETPSQARLTITATIDKTRTQADLPSWLFPATQRSPSLPPDAERTAHFIAQGPWVKPLSALNARSSAGSRRASTAGSGLPDGVYFQRQPNAHMLSAMDRSKTALELAFDLAKSGQFTSASEIKSYLAKHGFNAQQVEGGALMRQLKELIKDAKAQDARRP